MRTGVVFLVFPLNGNETALQIDRTNQGLPRAYCRRDSNPHVETKVAEIETSLFAAPMPPAFQTRSFNWPRSFLPKSTFIGISAAGDRFSVKPRNELPRRTAGSRSGRILAAEFVNNGRTHTAIWFETPLGEALTMARTEVQCDALSCACRRSSLHYFWLLPCVFTPSQQEWRAHRGIDYGAPTGTRVRATADGGGNSPQPKGDTEGYWSCDTAVYSTAYGHLSGFAKGLKKGTRVSQARR